MVYVLIGDIMKGKNESGKREVTEKVKAEVYKGKVAKGKRVKIPKGIVDKYQIEEGDLIKWISEKGEITKVEFYTLVERKKG